MWFVPKYLWSGEWPVWPWWGYAVAPLALGVAAATIEALGLGLIKILGERWGIIAILVLFVGGFATAVVINNG